MTKRERKKNQDIKYKIRNRSLGLCISCPKQRLAHSNKFCEKHYLMHVSYLNLGTTKRWKELEYLFQKQNGACAYTGTPLQFGLNASIDHIKPISKFPELKTDISNLQWVTKEINFLKNKFTEDELLFLCKSIYLKISRSQACGDKDLLLSEKQELSNLITIKI